jgi:hypothetical protein
VETVGNVSEMTTNPGRGDTGHGIHVCLVT